MYQIAIPGSLCLSCLVILEYVWGPEFSLPFLFMIPYGWFLDYGHIAFVW